VIIYVVEMDTMAYKKREKRMDPTKATPAALLLGLRWLARIGSVISLGLLLLFFLGEGFNPAKVASPEWIGFLFFPIGVAAGMLVGWWREGLGGAITTLSLLAFYGIYGFLLNGRLWQGAAFIAFAAPGILFLVYWLGQIRPHLPRSLFH
jgi:hypothetical protein